MNRAVVSSRGRIVIPSEIRKKFRIEKGTKLIFEERDGEIVLKPATHAYFQQYAGILPTGGKLTRALLEERKRSVDDQAN